MLNSKLTTFLSTGLAVALAVALGCQSKETATGGADTTKPATTATGPSGAKTAEKAPATQPVVHSPPAANDIPAPPDVAAPPADAEKTPSGLASKVLTPGAGQVHPEAQDSVTVNYTGWTTDGKMFDSSVKRGQPATFPLGGVVKGWTEGVQLMVEGEKRRFWIPAELAYGNRPGKPAGMLVFDIELISIKKGAKPLPAPPDVAAAPADAKVTESGIAYKVLEPGTGKDHPSDGSMIKMDFTGWTTDGKMVDSSITRGQPVTFPLKSAPPGFQEAIKLMVDGEKARIWIPAKLAQRGAPNPEGKPDDKLVFEIKILSIINLDAPSDVAAAPADAEKTKSGLASKVITKGTGTEHPSATSKVKVNYTGWTTDGKMFDSSVARGTPADFPLNAVIPGWTEGLQLMVVGEKRRFWIPAELAYKGKEGPQGLLVFDVELLEIKK